MRHNHFAILSAVVVNQILNLVWYSELFFLRGWLAEVGKEAGHINQENPLPFAAAVLASAAFCYVLSWVFQIGVVDDWQRGLLVGLLFGVGMLAPTLAMHYFYMGYQWPLVLIDGTKEVVGAGISGAILATYRADKIEDTEAV